MPIEPTSGQSAQTSAQNHDLLITIGSKVDTLASSLRESITQTSAEFDKLWKHGEERDRMHSAALQATTDKLAASIERVVEKQNGFGKPNIPAIVSVCVLIGSIAVAFIAPIKADIERHAKGAEDRAAEIRMRLSN